jgi:predicted transglutaminase-like cysteine proteinase
MRHLGASAACAALVCFAAPALAAGAAGSQRPIVITADLGPNMLGTRTTRIRADRFTGSWKQALEDASRSPALQRLVYPARRLNRLQQIAYVQRAVHGSIRWISDATEWGRHDYWATATQTLAHGAGDMEDRAIVKMHALKALGVSPTDLFLTLGRDRVGGPVTVLTVRSGGRYYVLDDTGGAPYAVDQRRFEFRPILSFGWAGAWVHSAPAAARAVVAMHGAAARK